MTLREIQAERRLRAVRRVAFDHDEQQVIRVLQRLKDRLRPLWEAEASERQRLRDNARMITWT